MTESPSTAEESHRISGRRLRWTVGGFLVVVLLYSFLVTQQILLSVILVFVLGLLWLLWRVVVAVERIAGAAETIAADRDRRGSTTGDADGAASPTDADRPVGRPAPFSPPGTLPGT